MTTAAPEADVLDRKPTMAERIDAEIDADPLGHQWVAQATISIDRKTATRAAFRGSFRSEEGMRIDALEVMCHVCRRPLDEVRDEPRCEGQIDNTHLIGGDPGKRAPRIINVPQGPIHYNIIDRRGMAGYSVHAGK